MANPGLPPTPAALLPTYVGDVDAPIVLFEGEGLLHDQGKVMKGECTIAFAWSPNQGPEVTFRGSGFIRGFDFDLEVPKLGLRAPVRGRQIKNGAGGPQLKGILSGRIELGVAQPLHRVEFHLGNFPSVVGESIAWGDNESAGRIRFSSAPWEVCIDPVRDTPPVGTRGFAITHAGSLSRSDGANFSVEDTDLVLIDVSRTLSFARGAFSCPFLRTGFNDKNQKVWQSWTGYRTDLHNGNSNWFSTHYPQVLNEVFQGWRRLAGDPNLEVISAASHLYIDSHAPMLAPETKLIIAQSALEGLAEDWPYPLPTGSVIPPSIQAGSAAHRMASIALSLGLTLDVPVTLPEFQTMPKPTPAASAPEKIAWVRNSIAHLGNFPRLVGVPAMAKHQAWVMSEHYLELALLRLLDVKGKCLNRCKVGSIGDVEKLPWI